MNIGPYQLNQVYTGDARELSKAIPDESIDLILLDPPFGIGFDYGEDYKDDPRKYADLIRWIISESDRVIKPGGMNFVFQAMIQLRKTWPLFPDDSRIFSACKNFVQMQGEIPYAFDPVIFWKKPGRIWAKAGRDFHVGNTANTNNRGLAEAGFHECPRPLDTIRYMIESFCPPGGIVCDFFIGSGTTAVAAKLTNRNFIGFEIRAAKAEQARERIRNTPEPLPGFNQLQQNQLFMEVL